VRVTEEALENTNVRAPFNGVVIKKRAEVGETVSPFGVAGQASRERRRDCDDRGSRRARSADRGQREQRRQAAPAMPAEVKLQAYQDHVYKGRCARFSRRPIAPSRSSKCGSRFSTPTHT
jgi:multidrug resistance efflux pump